MSPRAFCGIVRTTDAAQLEPESFAPAHELQTLARDARRWFARSANAHRVSFASADGVCAVIDGRPIWPDAELAAVAARDGHARALLAAYASEGTRLLSRLNGSFALALFDDNQATAMLAIDRLGVQRLCYFAGDDLLCFGTSAELVARHPRIDAPLDPTALYHYLYFHMVPSPRTVYRDVHKLPPGHVAVWRAGRVSVAPYWDHTADAVRGESRFQLAADLKRVIRVAVSRLAPSEDTGAFLSGGIDSSTVTGMLGAVTGQPPRTYTIGFDAEEYDERRFARITVRHFGARPTEYVATPGDVATVLPEIARAYDEPFGNSSAVPALLCARLAKADGIRLLLAGDGGDELYGGNARYAKQKVFDLWSRVPRALRQKIIEPALASVPLSRAGGPVAKMRSYVAQANVPMPDRLQTYNFLHRTPPSEVLAEGFLSRIDPQSALRDLRDWYAPFEHLPLVEAMLRLDWKITLADNDLRKVVTMCDLAGVEVAFPFLDIDVIEHSMRVPAAWKVRRLRLRHFYKEAMADFLPHEVIAKTKHGFGLPFGVWLRTDPGLRTLVGDSIATLRQRRIVSSAYLDWLTERHRDEHAAYYGEILWVLMMLELWLQAHARDARF